jgi:predicted RNA-binding Zn-ribbon protein involved in translation (DUF1610 family)
VRTIKRYSRPMNVKKLTDLTALVHAYVDEKNKWLKYLHSRIDLTKQFRTIRNQFVKDKYTTMLPPSHWKNALDDACKQMDMYWSALFVELRKTINANANLDKDQKHWCYAALKNYDTLGAVRQHRYDSTKYLSDPALLRKAGNYLNRILKRKIKKLPRVKIKRSMSLTSIVYTLKTYNDDQYLSVSSLTKGKPILVPLRGITNITGTIKLILDGERVQVHHTKNLQQDLPTSGEIEAVHLGYYEVLTDTHGKRYGTNLPEILNQKSDKIAEKGAPRNKLWQIAKKHDERGNHYKARRIRKYNLGRVKHNRLMFKTKKTIEREINQSLNEILRDRALSVLVTGEMSRQFEYKSGKKWNRRLSSWTRGVMKDRIDFKTLAACCRHEQVNQAYVSQLCPTCGYVHIENRDGDIFKCQSCGYASHADQVAAINLLARESDSDIGLYTSNKQLKTLLADRFQSAVGMDNDV